MKSVLIVGLGAGFLITNLRASAPKEIDVSETNQFAPTAEFFDRLGVEEGDILISINERSLTEKGHALEAFKALKQMKAGEKVKLRLIREGETRELVRILK